MTTRFPPSNSCSIISRKSGEQLFGTASQAQNWLLLEYPHPWEAKALQSSTLPKAVISHFIELQNTIPATRFQFIYRKSRSETGQIHLYICQTNETTSASFEFILSNYEEILTLNTAQILTSRQQPVTANLRVEPIYLVCVNGKRDPCCARFGIPIYNRMADLAPEHVWQTTHLGGHRFAANVVCLPDGIYYGRVKPADIKEIINEYQRKKIYIKRYRGRAIYSAIIQAADYFLREQTNCLQLYKYKVQEFKPINENEWTVVFTTADNQQYHQVRLMGELSAFQNCQSCRDEHVNRVIQYRLLDYQVI
jgi:hypothetical protein